MRVFVVGARAQARLVYNILRQQGHSAPFVYDRDQDVAPPWECEIFHDESRIDEQAKLCDAFVVCIGDVERGELRTRFSRRLQGLGVPPISAVHSSAVLTDTVQAGRGLQAIARSVVNDFTVIGDYCILGINCAVDHDCHLGEGVHIMGGASVARDVTIGNHATVGANSTILPHLTIGEGAIVGAGAVVTRDVPTRAVVAGVPARILRIR